MVLEGCQTQERGVLVCLKARCQEQVRALGVLVCLKERCQAQEEVRVEGRVELVVVGNESVGGVALAQQRTNLFDMVRTHLVDNLCCKEKNNEALWQEDANNDDI